MFTKVRSVRSVLTMNFNLIRALIPTEQISVSQQSNLIIILSLTTFSKPFRQIAESCTVDGVSRRTTQYQLKSKLWNQNLTESEVTNFSLY